MTLDGLASQGKHFKGEATGILFGTELRPTDTLVFSPIPAPLHRADLPTAEEFILILGEAKGPRDHMVTGLFSLYSSSSRYTSWNAVESSDPNLNVERSKKLNAYLSKLT